MKNDPNVQNFISWGRLCPLHPTHPRQSKNFIEETLLHRRQKNKRLLLTSSEEIFLNILCSKNFFSNEKIGKRP